MTLRKVERGEEPLRGLIALAGPSNSGKTFSALRIAAGLQEELKGKTALLDTELRGNLYHHRFEYDHFILDPPFSPRAWKTAIQDLDARYSVIISDNFSDEYEGPGGIAEMASLSTVKNDVAKWAQPKAEHKALMSKIRLLRAQHIFLLRASDKIEIYEGTDPKTGELKKMVRAMGWQPHAEKNFKYDITIGWMLPPESVGHANLWKSIDGFSFKDGEQLSEDHGREIARWIRGETKGAQPVMTVVTIRSANNVPFVTTSIWKEAADAYREVKKPVSGDPEGLALLRECNRDALMVLAEYAGPSARANLQAEITAAG
jgi:hypothetical protein